MSWYSARVLYESVHPEEILRKKDILFEEKAIVFRVDEGADFEAKLASVCPLVETEYENLEGNLVRWTFREVLEVQEIMIMSDQITDGTEVFFRSWHSPGVRAFKVMRDTHMEPWWPRQPKRPKSKRT
jgi:hypothetical protein